MANQEQLTTFVLGANPYVVIEAVEDPDDAAGFDIRVRADQVDSEDQLAILLLLVVEKITGVSPDLYVQEVDITRRAAGLSALREAE